MSLFIAIIAAMILYANTSSLSADSRFIVLAIIIAGGLAGLRGD